MSWKEPKIPISDTDHFQTLNGLWKGKKGPFVKAGVIRNTNFTSSGSIQYSNVAYLDVENKQFVRRRLESGDIILERSGGGPKQPVGRIVYFDREDGEFSFSNFTSVIRVTDKQIFEPRFIFYGLMELYQSGQTEDIQRRTTGIRNLDFTAYKERARFPLIPLLEQKKIAHILSTVQRAIETQERIIQTTTELKKALMQKLFTEGLRNEPQKQTEIGPIPESWDVVPLETLVEKTENIDMKDNRNRVISYIDVSSIYRDFLRINSAVSYALKDAPGRARKLVREGDTIFATVRPTLMRIAQINHEYDGYVCSTAFCVLRPKRSYLDNLFLFYLVQLKTFVKRLGTIQSGANYPAVTDKQVKIQLVQVPTLIEQEKIASYIQGIDKKISYHEQKRTLLSSMFQILLHELMNAKTRTHNLEFLQSE